MFAVICCIFYGSHRATERNFNEWSLLWKKGMQLQGLSMTWIFLTFHSLNFLYIDSVHHNCCCFAFRHFFPPPSFFYTFLHPHSKFRLVNIACKMLHSFEVVGEFSGLLTSFPLLIFSYFFLYISGVWWKNEEIWR